jgi:3-oxoacyl-[acyl-carrier-protein] synthase-1
MSDCVLNELGLVCALGGSKGEALASLIDGSMPGFSEPPAVKSSEPQFQSRNNRLLLAALSQIRGPVDAAIRRFGRGRVAIVLATSTSGIGEVEEAFPKRGADGAFAAGFHYGLMEIASPSEFLSRELDLRGPAYTISTACSSSAKALLSARRLLELGLCDAVLAGGADSLCRSTQAGFSSLEAVSAERCNPFSKNRKGINIGEGAALFLVTREGPGPRLLGGGESSDAHHISAPQPEGLGAAASMRGALAASGLRGDQIDYLNLHGTATALNDSMEAAAVAAVLGGSVPCSSTKPLTGHTLGAAGALEAAFCWLLLSAENPEGRLPAHVWDGAEDEKIPRLALVAKGARLGRPLKNAMTNSFGFGGSNASLILGRSA